MRALIPNAKLLIHPRDSHTQDLTAHTDVSSQKVLQLAIPRRDGWRVQPGCHVVLAKPPRW